MAIYYPTLQAPIQPDRDERTGPPRRRDMWQFPVTPPLPIYFFRPRRTSYPAPDQYPISQFIQGIVPTGPPAPPVIDILFQRALRQPLPFDDMPSLSAIATMRAASVDIPIPPGDIIFLRLIKQPVERRYEDFDESRFIFSLELEEDVQRIRRALPYDDAPSQYVVSQGSTAYITADIIVPINVLLQRPKKGIEQILEARIAPIVRRVISADRQPPTFRPVLQALKADIEVDKPRIRKVTFADVKFFHAGNQRPLKGIAQPPDEVLGSKIIVVTPQTAVPLNVLFQKYRQGVAQEFELFRRSFPRPFVPADVAPPSGNILLLQGRLRGSDQDYMMREPRSLMYGVQLHFTIIPLDIIRQKTTREPRAPEFEEFGLSQFLFTLTPSNLDLLFLQQRQGIIRDVDDISTKARPITVTPATPVIPLELILRKMRRGLIQIIEDVNKPRIISVPAPDFTIANLLFGVIAGLPRPIEELSASHILKIPFPDTLFYHFGPVLQSNEKLIEELRASFFIKGVPFEEFKFFYPMQGKQQIIEEPNAPHIVTVKPADILVPVDILLQQRPRQGLTQEDIIVGIARRISQGVKDIFAPPSVGRKLRRGWFRSGG